jgi:hypothetical protein
MKVNIGFILAFAGILIISCNYPGIKIKRISLEGDWQLVQVQEITNGKVTNLFPDIYIGTQFKMWSEKHFMFVGKVKSDTTIIDFYGGGTYTLDGDRYEEDVFYNSNKEYEGHKVKMLLEFRNDTLIQTYPVDNNGIPEKSSYQIEKYIRLD